MEVSEGTRGATRPLGLKHGPSAPGLNLEPPRLAVLTTTGGDVLQVVGALVPDLFVAHRFPIEFGCEWLNACAGRRAQVPPADC